MADDKKTTKKTTTKSKKAALVPVKWIHSKGYPGEIREFYGVKCTADEDGLFLGEISQEKAELEFNRENIFRFEAV